MPAGRVATVTVAVPAQPATGVVRAWAADRVPVPAGLRAALDAAPRLPDHRMDDHRVVDGSTPWWRGWTAWLSERSGGLREAPPELGGRGLHPVAPTPAEPVRV